MYVCVCKDVFSFQFVISRPVITHIMRVSNEGSSIPRSRLKFSLNPVVRRFILANPDDVRVMIFLTSIDPLKSIVTVRRKFISFHQNDDIVNFRSFQSFALITTVTNNHGNDFLSLNLQTYIGTGRSVSKKGIIILTNA